MKRFLTLTLLFIGLNSFANRTETTTNNNKAGTKSAVASETVSANMVNQLQLENKMLLNKLMALEQVNEEIKSQATYYLVMHAVINGLVSERQQQAIDELNAKMAYERTMASMLMTLGRK